MNSCSNCPRVMSGLLGTAEVGRSSATQHKIADVPGQRPLNVPPVHFERLMQNPSRESWGVVHVPMLSEVSGAGGKNCEDGAGLLGGSAFGQQVMPAGPGHLPEITDRGQFSVRVHRPRLLEKQLPASTPPGKGQHLTLAGPGHLPVNVPVEHWYVPVSIHTPETSLHASQVPVCRVKCGIACP